VAASIKKTGNWAGGRAVTNTTKFAFNIQRHFNKALLVNGEILRGAIVNGIRKNEFGLEELSDVTTTIKRSKVPLADRGDLTNSVTVKLAGPSFVFIGIPRGTKKRGKDMVQVAEIMHEGSYVGVDLSTPKGRKVMAAIAMKVRKRDKTLEFAEGAGIKPGFIVTPPRPFLPPAWRKASPFFSLTYAEAAKKVWKSQEKGT